MQSKLKSRLALLEKAMRKLPPPAVLGPSPALLLASRLAAMGIERGPRESLADTTARAMGISVGELRAKLWQLAGGSSASRTSDNGY
jgi:hypothetical protein